MEAAEALRAALADHGITADVHDGYGLAVVSVWIDLLVWCDGRRFWWRTEWNARQSRPVYAEHPALEPVQAAQRVALRYADLRREHPAEPEERSACPR
ncbi:hypothetical protein AB0D67_37260 [Streptosporangium sp. NPDC048047]|uniref:hypothetical protein n=1 Tax=Streptosporangium sp. NPDC048047 TaxID=3155748 RepID=UPI0034412318